MKTTTASIITRAASKQTYYTIRLLADRERMDDAYRAYGYFRWVDDVLDKDDTNLSVNSHGTQDRITFLERQKSLLERCYLGQVPLDANPQENMLVELVQHDSERNGGLYLYLHNMMRVMEFDARRRGNLISQSEIDYYTQWLSMAVMEAIHYFIGHDDYSPHDESRYLAVSAAHITHMLRDTYDDARLGYYNIPREVLEENRISPQDIPSKVYCNWVKSRVDLAHEYFNAGKRYFARVQNLRCRLACFAYIARFEWLLSTIERENYCLRSQYNERKSFRRGLQMSWLTLSSMINIRGARDLTKPVAPHSTGKL
jgi:phytoene/squalene synthetase